MKKYIIEYEFYGEKVVKTFDTIEAFAMWFETILEDSHILNHTISIRTE